MNFPCFDRRAGGLVIFAGFITLAFAAQGSAVPGVAPTKVSGEPITSGRTEQITAQVAATATSADSICDKQNWPYYSKECLCGGGTTSAPRYVHLQPAAPLATPTPVLAATDAGERKPIEFRPVTETARRPKVRQTPRYAGRANLQPHRMQPDSGFEQLSVLTW